MHRVSLVCLCCVATAAWTAPARAAGEELPFTLSAYAEAFYQWNVAMPSNRVTAYRGFDNRANTFTISNVALDVAWDRADLVGRVTFQVGHTPSTYYLAEPALPGGASFNLTGPDTWKYLQQAYAGYRLPFGEGLTLTAGLFTSPIGPETVPVRENWNWSRSTLFFGLPFYHAGARATYAFTDAWAFTAAIYNGWNNVTDNNEEKSISGQLTWTRDNLAFSALYFGGVERNPGAPEGRPWRHLFDTHLTWHITRFLSVMMHADTGFEWTNTGSAAWAGAALNGRFQLLKQLYVAVRGDGLVERVPRGASAIFFPSPWVASGTATLDFRPVERASLRLEARHDHAGAPMYFGGRVVADGANPAGIPNRTSQDTVTLGVTTWL